MTDPTAYGVCITFPILAILAVLARFTSRLRSKIALLTDDWLIIPALILSLGNAANVLWCAIVGHLGEHQPKDVHGNAILGPEDTDLFITGYISEIVVTLAIGLARLSIIFFYVRIFQNNTFRKWAIAVGGINAAYALAFAFLFAFQCQPISNFWNTEDRNARSHCINGIINVPYAIINVVLDIAVLVMPWPVVWGLQLRLKQKLAVLSIFMLGAVIVGVSIGKAHAFALVFQSVETTHDFTYAEAPLLYWTVPECCLSVVCACLPTLSPLFRGLTLESMFRSLRDFVSLRSFSSRSRTTSTGNSNDGIHMQTTMYTYNDTMASYREAGMVKPSEINGATTIKYHGSGDEESGHASSDDRHGYDRRW